MHIGLQTNLLGQKYFFINISLAKKLNKPTL